MSNAIYVYDNRTQYQEPIFVVYREEHVVPTVATLVGLDANGELPSFIVKSYTRLHPYDRDRYRGMGSVRESNVTLR